MRLHMRCNLLCNTWYKLEQLKIGTFKWSLWMLFLARW
jgi:hypothetical protein